MLRGRLREEQIIAVAIAVPAAFTAVGMLGVSVPLLVLIAGLVGLSTTLGRNAFDALVQRVAPDALLGRAGARYETEFQLAWVFGGILATPISLPVEVSMTVLTLMYVPGLLIFLRASRGARLQEGIELDPHALGRRSGWSWRGGRSRADRRASRSSTPCPRSTSSRACRTGRTRTIEDRVQLDEIRRRATDPAEDHRRRRRGVAVEIAGRWVNQTST